MARLRGFPSVLAALTVGTLEVTGAATFAATVTATGQFLAGDGSAGAPAYSFTSDPDTGFFYTGGHVRFAFGGVAKFGSIAFDGETALYSVAFDVGGFGDAVLSRDGAGIVAHRSGATAQVVRVYGTYTSGSVYERLAIGYQGGAFKIVEEQLGASNRYLVIGTNGTGNLQFQTGGTVRWQFDSSGHLLAATDNTYDIGGASDNRPRCVYSVRLVSGSDVTIDASSPLYFSTRSKIKSSADGLLTLLNDAETDFERLCFGGTTSAFPALRRNGNLLEAVFADESNYAPFRASAFKDANNVQVVGGQGAAVADATGAGDVVAQLNTLLARLRAHGLIAT